MLNHVQDDKSKLNCLLHTIDSLTKVIIKNPEPGSIHVVPDNGLLRKTAMVYLHNITRNAFCLVFVFYLFLLGLVDNGDDLVHNTRVGELDMHIS